MTDTTPVRASHREQGERHRLERRWLPMLAVLAVMAVATLGGFVVAAALSKPAGPPVGFPGLVQVQPLSGWEPASPDFLDGRSFVRLTRGSGTLLVLDWGASPSDPRILARTVVDEALTPSFAQVTVSQRLSSVVLADGTPGARFTFVGTDAESGGSVEGEITAAVGLSGRAVVFVGLAPEGLLAFVDGDLHTMVDQAEVG